MRLNLRLYICHSSAPWDVHGLNSAMVGNNQLVADGELSILSVGWYNMSSGVSLLSHHINGVKNSQSPPHCRNVPRSAAILISKSERALRILACEQALRIHATDSYNTTSLLALWCL